MIVNHNSEEFDTFTRGNGAVIEIQIMQVIFFTVRKNHKFTFIKVYFYFIHFQPIIHGYQFTFESRFHISFIGVLKFTSESGVIRKEVKFKKWIWVWKVINKYQKQQRTQNGALGDAMCYWEGGWVGTIYGNKLRPSCKIWFKPLIRDTPYAVMEYFFL